MSAANPPPDREPLGYSPARLAAKRSTSTDNRQFLAGLGIGVVVSALAYGIPVLLSRAGKSFAGEAVVALAMILLVFKLIGGIILSCSRSGRSFGLGLLLSLILGALIFAGTCAMF